MSYYDFDAVFARLRFLTQEPDQLNCFDRRDIKWQLDVVASEVEVMKIKLSGLVESAERAALSRAKDDRDEHSTNRQSIRQRQANADRCLP